MTTSTSTATATTTTPARNGSDSSSMANQKEAEVLNIEDEDDSSLIDDEQLEEYREMIDQLGSFPVGNAHVWTKRTILNGRTL